TLRQCPRTMTREKQVSLAELAKGRPPSTRNRRQKCSVGIVLDRLPDPEADGLRIMLSDQAAWPGSAIARALIDEGHTADDRPIKGNTIQRHRRGDCSCDNQEDA